MVDGLGPLLYGLINTAVRQIIIEQVSRLIFSRVIVYNNQPKRDIARHIFKYSKRISSKDIRTSNDIF